jgi:glycosyltransferase involved in cell wall biosynthesis
MAKEKLSVTLATYNEEANIEKCLRAVADIADEIVIVDGSSSDKTTSIAKKMGARVFTTTNKPNFHINKVMANKKAKYPWVLQLDADEFVTPKLKSEISALLENKSFGENAWQSPLKRSINRFIPIFPQPIALTTPASAYWLKRKNFFLGRYLTHTGQYPDPVIRLFQKDKAYLPGKDVHEQMVVDGPVGWLSGDLDHYATPEFSRYLTRENRYSSLEAQHLHELDVQVNLFNTCYYLFIKPLIVFIKLYVRYRGFLDGFPGFVFSLFSGLHFSLAYIKLWQLQLNHQ